MKLFVPLLALVALVVVQECSAGTLGSKLLGVGALGGYLAGFGPQRRGYYPGRDYGHGHGYHGHGHGYPTEYYNRRWYNNPGYGDYYHHHHHHYRGKRQAHSISEVKKIAEHPELSIPPWNPVDSIWKLPYKNPEEETKAETTKGEKDQVIDVEPSLEVYAWEQILRLDIENCVLKLACQVEDERKTHKNQLYGKLHFLFGNFVLHDNSANKVSKTLNMAIILGRFSNSNQCSKRYPTCDASLENMMDVLFRPEVVKKEMEAEKTVEKISP